MSVAALSHPCLVVDVGGTHARFAVVPEKGAALSPVCVLQTGSARFEELASRAIQQLGGIRPRSMLVAAAGPVSKRSITLTNALQHAQPIVIDGPALLVELELEQGLLLNDFEGLCLALPFLAPDQLLPLGVGMGDALGVRVVVGPGTGLGVGALLHEGGTYLPLRSEGGHMSLGPHSTADHALWAKLTAQLPKQAFSAEDLLSGRGLSLLHRMYAGLAQPWPSADVIDAALTRDDAHALQAIEMFFTLLGRFARDMALCFHATGGVYLGGGLLPRLEALVQNSGLRAAFNDSSTHGALLARMPVLMIRDPMATLAGLAKLGSAPELFRIDYQARFWRV